MELVWFQCRTRGVVLYAGRGVTSAAEGGVSIRDGLQKGETKLREELLEAKKELKQRERELARKGKALAERAALLALQKKKNSVLVGGKRGRRIEPEKRVLVLELVEEAWEAGARLAKAWGVVPCKDLREVEASSGGSEAGG